MQVERDDHGSLGRRRRGTAAVELALAAPVLILFVAGVVETCRVLHLQQSLALAAYEGARVAIKRGTTTQDAIDKCNEILTIRNVRNSNVDVLPDVASAIVGDVMTVTVEASADSNSVIAARYFGGDTLRYTVSMMKEY